MSSSSFSRKLARLQGLPAPGKAPSADGGHGDETQGGAPPNVDACGDQVQRFGAARGATDGLTRGSAERPSLDALRDRIASVLARSGAPKAPSRFRRHEDEEELRRVRGASTSTLPFLEEETAVGPLFLARKRTPIAARFGDAPLHAATSADPTLLALLARDPNLARCDPRHALFLDTETTGLMGGTGTVPFLIGLAYFDEEHDSFVVEQMLLRRFGEERPMLAHLAERLARASFVVTFNGKSFDVPLVRARAVMNRLPSSGKESLSVLPHLDLLHVARRVHGGWLGSCSLRSVEEHVLGHVRYDDVAGSDICAAYFHFARTGDEYALGGVVEHNLTDVLAMVALLGFYGEPITSAGGLRRAEDLAGVARTLSRAGAHERAEEIADLAIQRGGGRRAHHVRADIVRARGDKARAIHAYEAALACDTADDQTAEGSVDDEGRLHLALAKLYEHAPGSFDRGLLDRALEIVDRGTSESAPASSKRRARLVRKLEVHSKARSTAPRSGGATGQRPEVDADAASTQSSALRRRRSRGAS
ncbi:MAG: ribonuclease H-like domain-containing protein [Polyangiaceae bacterium]